MAEVPAAGIDLVVGDPAADRLLQWAVPVKVEPRWQYDSALQNHSGHLCGGAPGVARSAWLDPVFCDALWCMPCQLARQLQALGMCGLERRGNTQPCAVACGIVASVAACKKLPLMFLAWRALGRVQRDFGLPAKDGTPGGCGCGAYPADDPRRQPLFPLLATGGNCCSAVFCAPCMLTHTHKELSVRGLYPGVCCCGKYVCRMSDPDAGPAGYCQPQPGYAPAVVVAEVVGAAGAPPILIGKEEPVALPPPGPAREERAS